MVLVSIICISRRTDLWLRMIIEQIQFDHSWTTELEPNKLLPTEVLTGMRRMSDAVGRRSE